MSPTLPETLANTEIRETEYRIPPISKRRAMRARYRDEVREQFVRHLATTHADDLRRLGITDTEIEAMAEKGRSPEGYQIHHKLPIGGGGNNDFDNLVLMDVGSHADLHAWLEPQIRSLKEGWVRKVRLPWPAGAVHVPPCGPRLKPCSGHLDIREGWGDDPAPDTPPTFANDSGAPAPETFEEWPDPEALAGRDLLGGLDPAPRSFAPKR